MSSIDFFKKTFIGTFVFVLVFKTVLQLFEGFIGFTIEFAFKTFFTALITASTLGLLNSIFKVDFKQKKQQTIQPIKNNKQ